MFSARHVALAVISYYPYWYEGKLRDIADTGKVRGDLAIEFAKKASNLGYHLVIVDGGSSQNFLEHFSNLPQTIVTIMHAALIKRSPKKQRAYLIASQIPGVEAIVSTEMEKVDLINFIPQIVDPILTNKADIVIPKRQMKEFQEYYPLFQFVSETQGNEEYNAILRKYKLLTPDKDNLDILFGPIAFRNSPEILKLFLQRVRFRTYEDGKFPSVFHDPDQYSNAYFFPTVMALQQKLPVTSVTIPFKYPEVQKENEEYLRKEFLEKRKLQKEGIVSNLQDFLTYSW